MKELSREYELWLKVMQKAGLSYGPADVFIAALETANADLLEVLEELLDSTVYADAEGLIDIDRGGCDDSDHREIVERCKQAIRRHKGE